MQGSDDENPAFSTPEKQHAAPDAESVMRRSIASIFADSSLTPAEKFARVNALRGIGQQQQKVFVLRGYFFFFFFFFFSLVF